MQFYIVDAFTDKPFGGNPAGVVIYDSLDDDNMQKLATELRYSETAFIKPIDKRIFHIRFFTPNAEVELCGHATIASFGALLNSKYIFKNNFYYMKTKAGMLKVFIKDDFIMMEQAVPKAGPIITEVNSFSNALNIDSTDIGDINYSLNPQAISTGLFDIILPIKNREILGQISPNFSELSKLSRLYGVVGIHAFTLDEKCFTASCRNFAPLFGIDEEAATGTANGALTYYLYLNNVLKEFNKDYTFIQGQKMNRPSKIVTRIESNDGIGIFVGGSYSIIAKGKLLL